MGNVFYLLGAGASVVNSHKRSIPMPLANNFAEVLNKMKECNSYKDLLIDNMEIRKVDFVIDDFINFIANYNTIDEGMRMLYLNRDNDKFQKYKKWIQLLFFFIESLERFRDNRYLQFLLTVVDGNKKLPEWVKILSWNYDNQMEYSAKELNFNYEDNTLNEENFFKINALKAKDEMLNKFDNIADEKNIVLIKNILNTQDEIINFAWEKDDTDFNKLMSRKRNDYLERINSAADNCIVAIGYSFPYVNHLIDREFLLKINPAKVYVQNTDRLIASTLEERFKLNRTKFISIENCDRFYIPNELYLK